MSEKTKGILCIIFSALSFAFMSLFIKLSGDIPTLQKSFFRNFVAALVAFLMLKKNHTPLKCSKESFKYVFGRAFFGTVGIFCNFYGVDHLNIADASMLNKLSPFFAIIFSFFILKEKVAKYKEQGIEITLAVVKVGNDPASAVYVRNKEKACEYVGINSKTLALPEETTEEELLALVEKLNAEVGSDVTFDKVLLVGGEQTKVGAPYVEGASVKGTVTKNGKSPKVVVFKYKAKANYRRTQGHRQPYTRVTIDSIDC